MFPESVNVKQQAGMVEIVWDTGQTSLIPLLKLRQDCPCATCAQERGENPHPGLLDAPPPKEPKKRSLSLPLLGDIRKFAVDSMHHVGHYALGVVWADNHKSIYTWEFLRDAGE